MIAFQTNSFLKNKTDRIHLCDEFECLPVHEMTHHFEKLDVFFEKCNVGDFHCIYFPVQNSIRHVILLLYFIHRRINFFQSSANNMELGAIPPFCDKSLVFGADTNIENPIAPISIVDHSGYNRVSVVLPGSGAVIFSSSGSTGTPKYVYFSSEKLLKNAANCIKHFGINSTSRILIPVPIGHMFGLGVGLLPAIQAGCSFCLIEKNNVLKLYDQFSQFRPEVCLINPSVCKMLLKLGKNINFTGRFISAGEQLSPEIQELFSLKYGHLINLYGCTEMGAIATTAVRPSAEISAHGNLNPIDGVEIKIDEASGEILCNHPAAFEYYVHANGDTNSLSYEPGTWYHTKDAGKMTGDKGFIVTGRMDHCINRFGFLLSLQELEAKLENVIPAINQAVTFETTSGALVAVCSLKDDQEPDLKQVKALCGRWLPRHSIPDQFYFVQEIPRLFNGKPDRTAMKNEYSLKINYNEHNKSSVDHDKA